MEQFVKCFSIGAAGPAYHIAQCLKLYDIMTAEHLITVSHEGEWELGCLVDICQFD